MPEPRTCPRAGCTRTITADLFACSTHWNALPSKVRDDIWSAFRRYKRGRGDVLALVEAHDAAFAVWGQDGPE